MASTKEYPFEGYKYLSVNRLSELLEELKAKGYGEHRLTCNIVTKNLTVITPTGDSAPAMIEFLYSGEIEWFL